MVVAVAAAALLPELRTLRSEVALEVGRGSGASRPDGGSADRDGGPDRD